MFLTFNFCSFVGLRHGFYNNSKVNNFEFFYLQLENGDTASCDAENHLTIPDQKSDRMPTGTNFK